MGMRKVRVIGVGQVLMDILCISIGLMGLSGVFSEYPKSIKSGGYGYETHTYLPAPPGQTPPCAKYGATYCEKVQTYPREAIWNLLEKYGYTYSLFIKSESEADFIMAQPSYGYGYGYGYGQGQGQGQGHRPISSSGYDTSHSPTNISYSYSQGARANQNPDFTTHHYYPAGSEGMKNNHQEFAAAVVPILHSIWWNHVDRNNRPVFPYLPQNTFFQHRIKKRQAIENQLCQVTSRFVTPEAAMNNEGNWMYVVNMGQSVGYAQQVRIETCTAMDSECNGICQVPPGYRAICRQKYTQKRLVALDPSGSTLRNGVFWIPLCCVLVNEVVVM